MMLLIFATSVLKDVKVRVEIFFSSRKVLSKVRGLDVGGVSFLTCLTFRSRYVVLFTLFGVAGGVPPSGLSYRQSTLISPFPNSQLPDIP